MGSKTVSRLAYFVAIVAVLAIASAPAHAQRRRGGHKQDPAAAAAAAEKKKKAREIDEGYKAALKAIPNKPKADPWGSMR